jgi:hypothetical protein
MQAVSVRSVRGPEPTRLPCSRDALHFTSRHWCFHPTIVTASTNYTHSYSSEQHGARNRRQRDCHASHGTQEDRRLHAEVWCQTAEHRRLLQEDAWPCSVESCVATETAVFQHRAQGTSVERRCYARSKQLAGPIFESTAHAGFFTIWTCKYQSKQGEW